MIIWGSKVLLYGQILVYECVERVEWVENEMDSPAHSFKTKKLWFQSNNEALLKTYNSFDNTWFKLFFEYVTSNNNDI